MEPLFPEEIKRAVEALLFVAGEPVTGEELAAYTETDIATIDNILSELTRDYARGGFTLEKVAGGWQFMTAPELNGYIARLYKPKLHRLSKAAMETLAIIAYCQPVTRGDIEEIRGVNADSIVAGLLEKGLLTEVGRKDTPGKPILYGTNSKFLQLLGLNSLEELPPVDMSLPGEKSLFAVEKDEEELFDTADDDREDGEF